MRDLDRLRRKGRRKERRGTLGLPKLSQGWTETKTGAGGIPSVGSSVMGKLSTELSRDSTFTTTSLQTKVNHWTTTSAFPPGFSYTFSRNSAVRIQTQTTTSAPAPAIYSHPLFTSSVTVSIVRETPVVLGEATGSTQTGNDNLQTITSGLSSIPHSTTTPSDDQSPAESATISGTDTWVIVTAAEVSSSSIATLSSITTGGTSPASSVSLHSASSPATSDVASSTFPNTAPDTSSLAQSAHTSRVGSTSKIGTVAGATAGAVVVLLLIFLAAFAYARGGAMRGLGSDKPSRINRLRSSFRRAPLVDQSHENACRRGTMDVRAHDLETATVSSGSHYDDIQDGWEDVDLYGMRAGEAGKDKGEWLESWRRGKERMMSASRPPTLAVNPQLPLPPIILEVELRKD